MKIKIITVGRLKEDFYKKAAAEYEKRLSRFHKITVTELSEESKSDSPSETEIEKALLKEGKSILKSVSNGAYVIALAICGKAVSSEALAEKIKKIADGGTGEIDFIIGGSHGLSDEVLSRADFLLSF